MNYIIGSDEVGYGAWSGPGFVCAAAVPQDWAPPAKLKDSKKLSESVRNEINKLLRDDSKIYFSLVSFSVENIDKNGVYQSLLVAHDTAINNVRKSLENRNIYCDNIIVDGKLKIDGAKAIIKADNTIPTVMAASVLAKVHRDNLMISCHNQWPEYGFDKHKGYGTEKHKLAIEAYGIICGFHRISFKPCLEAYNSGNINVKYRNSMFKCD